MTVFDAARAHMIESQIRPNKVTDERVLAAYGRDPARAVRARTAAAPSPMSTTICRSAAAAI